MRNPLLLAAAILGGTLAAQTNAVLGAPLNDPNFPGGTNKLDLQAILTAATTTTVNGILGCARDNAGNYWVSARSPVLAAGQFHKLFELDKNGAFVKAYDVPQTYSATVVAGAGPWGLRDLAYDPANNLIYGGSENISQGGKVIAFDLATKAWAPSKDWTAPAATTVIRALAYNPKGDNGNGSMWTGNFGAALYEFRKDGTVIQTLPANAIQKLGSSAIYGAAWNPLTDTILWFSQLGSSRTTGGGYQVVGLESTTGNPAVATGNAFFGDQTVAGTPPGGIAGGIEFSLKNGKPTLVCTHQANSDTMAEIYGSFNHGVGCDGRLLMNGEVPYTGNAAFALQLTASNAKNGQAVMFVSSGEPPVPIPIGGGCFLNIGLFPPSVFFQVGAVVPVDAAGKASFPAPIPTGLGNLEVRLQTFAVSTAGLFSSDLGKTLIYN